MPKPFFVGPSVFSATRCSDSAIWYLFCLKQSSLLDACLRFQPWLDDSEVHLLHIWPVMHKTLWISFSYTLNSKPSIVRRIFHNFRSEYRRLITLQIVLQGTWNLKSCCANMVEFVAPHKHVFRLCLPCHCRMYLLTDGSVRCSKSVRLTFCTLYSPGSSDYSCILASIWYYWCDDLHTFCFQILLGNSCRSLLWDFLIFDFIIPSILEAKLIRSFFFGPTR